MSDETPMEEVAPEVVEIPEPVVVDDEDGDLPEAHGEDGDLPEAHGEYIEGPQEDDDV